MDRIEQPAVDLKQAAIRKQFNSQTLFDTTDKGYDCYLRLVRR